MSASQTISSPNPNTPYHTSEDSSYLASISPSTIFLHDGVLRSLHLSDLKEFEHQAQKFHDALTISSVDQMEELMAIGLSTSPTTSGSTNHHHQNSNNNSTSTLSTEMLSRKILKLATLHIQSIGLHHRYQWHILEKVWRYNNARALEQSAEDNAAAATESDKDSLFAAEDVYESPNNSLSFKLSLCLLVPMLELYSQENNTVAISALQLLFSELESVPVMSLSKESSLSLEKLENLLGRWAASPSESFQNSGPSAMIALCCARGVISSFAKTILILENLESPMRSLPVAGILRKLNNSRMKIGKPCSILGNKYVTTWPYDDRLSADALASGKSLGANLGTKELVQLLEQVLEERGGDSGLPIVQQNRAPTGPTRPNTATTNNITTTAASPQVGAQNAIIQPEETLQKHFVATDGTFLFVTGPGGKGISKMGSGLQGSLQGWVYHNNIQLKAGYLAFADGLLISRTVEIDTLENSQKKVDGNKLVLGVVLNQNTLKPETLLLTQEDHQSQQNLEDRNKSVPIVTLAMISDGSVLYFVKAEMLPAAVSHSAAATSTPKDTTTGQPTNEAPPPLRVWVDAYTIMPPTKPGSNVFATPKFLGMQLSSPEEGSNTLSGSGAANTTLNSEGNRISLSIGGGSEDTRGAGGGGGGNLASVRRTRSVRLTPMPPLPPPLPPSGGAINNSLGDPNTTLNVSLKQLQNALYFTCGNYLTVVVGNSPSVGGGALLLSPPTPTPLNPTTVTIAPASAAPITFKTYSPVISPSCAKPTGLQLHFSLHTSTPSLSSLAVSSKQDLHTLPSNSSFYHGATVQEMGATFDPTNNVIWTINGNLLDIWKNPGHIPPWKQNKMLNLGNTTNDLISVDGPSGQHADVKTVTNVMLRHIAVMANHFLLGDREDANIGFGPLRGVPPTRSGIPDTTEEALKTLLELLCKYRGDCEGSELTALFLTLQAIVSQISCNLKKKAMLEHASQIRRELYNVQVLVLCLLNEQENKNKLSDNPVVFQEACTLFSMTFDLLYTTAKARSDFFQELYQYLGLEHEVDGDNKEGDQGIEVFFPSTPSPSSIKCLRLLEDSILQRFTKSLDNHPVNQFKEGLKWVVDTPWMLKVIQQVTEETKAIVLKVADSGFSEEQVIQITANYPITSIPTAYLEAVVSFFMRSLVLQPTTTSSSSSATSSTSSASSLQRNIADLAVEVFRDILKAGPIIVESILEVISGTEEGAISYRVYSATEAILKSSLLAHGIPQILGLLSLENAPRPILDELTEECIQLTVAMSFLARKMNPGTGVVNSPSSHLDIGDDWSSKVHIPSPWTTKRTFESPHPIRESFKTKETIVIPGARQLYAKFSPQCATQYDYDRLSFSITCPASTSTPSPQVGTAAAAAGGQAKKVLDFGGNYYGFGNRFFSGPGWARQLVKICDGSTFQYNFEMKSGREHSVPDKALWGYQFTLFPVMDHSDPFKPQKEMPSTDIANNTDDDVSFVKTPLSPITPGFVTITTLHCIDVIQNIASVLLVGTAPTLEENANKTLLENKVVAGLNWPKALKEGGSINHPRKFSAELVAKVKRAVGIPPLQMRLSIIEKIRASDLEELYLQCCMAHIGPNPFLNTETILSPVCESCWSQDSTRDILREIFHNIDTMFRRLMAFYEMEKMLCQEIEEISNHTKDISEAFFNDSAFLESTADLQTLAWICYLDYDKDNPKNLINDVIAMCTALSADPSTPPQLTRTDELIEETHLKCKYLLIVPSSSTSNHLGPVYPSQKMVTEKLHLIHSFISAHLYNPRSTMSSLITAMRKRRERAGDRIRGLDILHKVLECSSPSSALLIVTSFLLQSGPRLHSILCSGLEKEVLKIFGEVMKTAVGIAEKNPLLHRYTIALLSITAYDRTDEENLVDSGLVGVLDQLCAYQTGHLTPLFHRSSPTETGRMQDHSSSISPEIAVAHNKASTLAWAAFQVLASQCASWERPHGYDHRDFLVSFMEDPLSEWDEPEHRELPLQISINITNHLARAAALAALSSSMGATNKMADLSHHPSSSCSPSLAVAIQDVLDLLNNLRTYKIGRAILKQSPCICRLLGLLQDSRLSPRLVLTILKLLHTALPLVDDLDTANFKQIVPFGRAGTTGGAASSNNTNNKGAGGSSDQASSTMASFWSVIESTPYTQVTSMLLSKLADYLVCGSSTATSTHSKLSPDANNTKLPTCSPGRQMKLAESPAPQGLIDSSKYDRMEVWVHKSSTAAADHHQSANNSPSLIRQLFMDATRQDLKPIRGTLNELENEFNSSGKVLLYTDEASVAERKALRISQLGYLATLLPAGWSRTLYNTTVYNTGATSAGGAGADFLCKDRNTHLATWDPARPFLSGHVAENLASEIVQLVRALLNSSSVRGRSQSMSGLSTSGSRGNIYQSGGSNSASDTDTSMAVGASNGGGVPLNTICTGGDTDSLASEASAYLQASGSLSQKSPSLWPGAVEQIICAALKLLPKLCQMTNPTGTHLESYVYSARLVIAALTVLGGFTETIRSGLEVWIVDEPHNEGGGGGEQVFENDQWEYKARKARVLSVSETCPIAKVELIPNGNNNSNSSKKNINKTLLATADVLLVPVCRLVPAHFTKRGQPNLPTLSRPAQMDLAGFLKTLLISNNATTTAASSSKGSAAAAGANNKEYPLKRDLPTLNQIVTSVNPSAAAATSGGNASDAAQTQSESRQIAQSMTIVRLLAEIRTKSMQVLSLWLKRPEFREIFLGIGSDTDLPTKRLSPEILECTENLKELSNLCVPSHKPNSLEVQLAWIRLLYRDCTKPPRMPISAIDKPTVGTDDALMRWDLSRQVPKIKSAVFSSISNSLVYTGDYNVSGGNPRGLVLFGNGVIPTNGYYWEATIVTLEDMGMHADLIVVPPLSIGFSPAPPNTTTSNDIWKYPSGTVMYTTLGRVIHYKTQDPGSWVTLRLDDDMFRLKAGDTIGIGWEKQTNSSSGGPQTGNATDTLAQTSQRAYGRAGRRMQSGAGRLTAVALGSGGGGGRNNAIIARNTNQPNLDSSGGNNSLFGVRGVVYFTLNGRRLPASIEQSNCGLHPIIHVQKRQMIVATNLGEKPYLYEEANKILIKPKQQQQPEIPHSASAAMVSQQEHHRNTTAEIATADGLLRRVSDSLQDLNLVFNMDANEFESDADINVPRRSGSSSTISGTSTRARRGDRVDVDEVDEEEVDSHPDEDDWNLDDEDDDIITVEPEDDDVDIDDDGDDDGDDDDEDPTEMATREQNRAGGATGAGTFRVLPPSPVSGVSTNGSSIGIRRAATPAPPPTPPPLPPAAAAGASTRQRSQRPTTARSSGGASSKKKENLRKLENASLSSNNTRKKNEVTAKAPVQHVEYDPIKSLEYFLGHSPTSSIKVFHGPRRYVCPCAVHTPSALDHLLIQPSSPQDTSSSSAEDRIGRSDMDSLDSYEDDEGDDDIHSQLVKAWEQQVFPVIRRRFRNESERRDGLEQIRGALQLGMWEIARQTVEFLYEEGGGLPRDLHFPTLDEVRMEQARCTMDKLKPGMNVVIRPLSQQQQQPQQHQSSNQQQQNTSSATADVALLPPSYAVATMLRTFGLSGEVLEVDVTHDLVLVETYIESEGVLVRFWYPVSCLDRGQSNKKPMLSTSTVNMFKLFSNLIAMEGSLCYLYSRQCYCSIIQFCNKNLVEESILESIPEDEKIHSRDRPLEKSVVDFDVDSLQILSDNSLSHYPPSRDLFTYNLQCESPSIKFLTDPANPSVLFYHRGDHTLLSQYLRYKIRECCKSSSPTETLDKLSEKLLSCLESCEKFPRHEVRLDRIHDLEVHCPGSAFVLVSFKGPQNITAKQLSSIDNTIHPSVHVFSYDSSEITRYPMACYPLEPLHVVMHRASSTLGEDGTTSIISHTAPTTAGATNPSAATAINKTMRKRHARFPPVMCPTDRVYCSISEATIPDVRAEIQGIPKQFPLALLYIQELIKQHANLEFENITFAVSRLLDFLNQIHLCPVIKDWIFPLLADLTRIRSKDVSWRPPAHEKVARSSTPNRLFLELLLLRERESAEQSLPTHTVPLITALSEHLDRRQPSLNSPTPKVKPMVPATLMFHISNFISSHQKSNKSVTELNFSFYFNSLNDLCLALNEVSEIMVNPYEIIPCSAHPSTESSPAATPPRRPSSTESGISGFSSPSSSPSSQVVPFSAVTKRPYAKATRKRQVLPSSKDGFKVLKEQQKKSFGNNGSPGTSGQSGATPDKVGSKSGVVVQASSSEDGFLVFAKASEVEWFNNQVIITRVLKDFVWHTPNDAQSTEAAQVLIGTVLEKLKTPGIHNRLLVIQGAPVNIDGMSIEASLIRALRGCGGVHGNELWINGNSAVVEIRSLAKVNEAYETLKQNKVWYPLEDYVLYPNVSVLRVNESLKVIPSSSVSASSSSSSSDGSSQEGDRVLGNFLKSKLADPEIAEKLSFKTREVLTSIFMSCYGTSIPFIIEGGEEEETEREHKGGPAANNVDGGGRIIILGEEQMTLKIPGNLLDVFFGAIRGSPAFVDPVKDILAKFGEKIKSNNSLILLDIHPDAKSDEIKDEDSSKVALVDNHDHQTSGANNKHASAVADQVGLGLQGFLDWCTALLKTHPSLLWKALFAVGYDLRLERVWLCQDAPVIYNYFHSPEKWQLEKDAALISYVDQFSQSLHIDPTRIQAPELNLTESDYLNPAFSTLQGVPTGYLRVRWGMLQKMNTLISKKVLAHGSLHTVWSSRRSLANLLHESRQLLLYYMKDSYLNKIIHVSASRGSDTPTPEITLDPVSSIGNQDETAFKNQLSQVIQQMSVITTAFYCVPPAQGADPALPISVKFQGEEVLGLSGSFRHFLLNAANELQTETVRLFCRCPSADAGRNKDNFIITPGNLSYGEEDFLYFLGQLIGISIRSDAPLALPLLKATWRSLLLSEKELNDSSDDLVEADILCATYLRKLESLATKSSFENFLSLNAWPKFQYPSMNNTYTATPLCPDGSSISVSFSNRDQFIKLIKQLREKELRSSNKVTKILTGLASIVPLPALLGLFTSDHLELRVAGAPDVNLSLLKSHTHYQVGISENDPHIIYFWAALESFSPEELRKFIKFSSNLERLPVTCPCQSSEHSNQSSHDSSSSSSSNNNTVHVPPFPMKIAPIDMPPGTTAEEIDRRLIRVETCLFLIRLPPYSSLQVTRQQLLFAINCREDPLSG